VLIINTTRVRTAPDDPTVLHKLLV